ncbi:metallophosphoesterase [Flavobacterium amniphilum]|uniref:metallophosphoesterase family protein n=1 Tax=Flavobacterium amniphilum TaxID=1834035 RepID=UPI00202A0660|nr:metallophosphoesterase [Flavobacterium amniphilum]MCL9803888.1 metallophosphoesterase [Flavobacterium amniphilum]
MRIVHLSDIHLSKDNYQDFENYYKDALIGDLVDFNKAKKIDVIVITGDLVDKGGESLFEIDDFQDKTDYPCPYKIFEEAFIAPIVTALNLSRENFLFVPGNHDVDESEILLKEEYVLSKTLDFNNVNQYLKENLSFKHSYRIKKFKEFEKKFHNENFNYEYTNNQSTFVYKSDRVNVGFVLVNDSWRCRSQKLDIDKGLIFGVNQIYDGMNFLKRKETNLNIVLMHHPVKEFIDKEELERCFNTSEIGFYLYGHYHSNDFIKHYEGYLDKCFGIRGRASLNRISEKESSYSPGYQILDLDFEFKNVKMIIHYRQYKYKRNQFDYDTDACSGGRETVEINKHNMKSKPHSLDRRLFELK